MAKKSARSKGYRKQTAKKPYLSKRDITLLCVLVVAIAIGAFFLFRYDDGALKVQQGAVVVDGDNWLIVNGSNTRGGARYYKLGEMGEIDGYERQKESIATDANIPQYVFKPAEDSEGATVTVTTSHSDADTLSRYAVSMLSGMENTEIGEIQTAELGGQSATYFIYSTEYESAEDAAEAEGDAAEAEAEADSGEADAEAQPQGKRYSRVLSGYVDALHESCVAVHVSSEADADNACLSDDALIALLEQAVSAVPLETAK